MKTHYALLAGLAVVGFAALAPAMAQTTENPKAARDQTMSNVPHEGTAQTTTTNKARRLSADTNFVTKAAQGGMAEVELGKLATQRASSAAVKQFGQRMIDDHSKANEELKTIATNEGINIPTTLDAKDQAVMDRLSKLNGAEFDRAYMADMVKDHRNDISEFKREADHGSNPAVKDFASKTLPTLESHLQMAESTDSQVKK